MTRPVRPRRQRRLIATRTVKAPCSSVLFWRNTLLTSAQIRSADDDHPGGGRVRRWPEDRRSPVLPRGPDLDQIAPRQVDRAATARNRGAQVVGRPADDRGGLEADHPDEPL